MIRHKTKACCGRSNLILEAPSAIRAHQISVFEGAGYSAPKSHKSIGIFYVRKDGLVATAPYGSRRITIYCGKNCDEKIDAFEKILEQAIAS